MPIAILVLGLACLLVLLSTGMILDISDTRDVDTLGLTLTFLVVPMILAITILSIIQVAS